MSTTNWGDKLSYAIDAEWGVFAKANVAAVEGTINGRDPDSPNPDPDMGARMVCNISSVHVPLFVAASLKHEPNPYKNGYDLKKYRIGGSAPGGGFKAREAVDRALSLLAGAGPDQIYFGAVELNGAGIRFYGDICLVLRRDEVAPDTAILDRNSYDLIRSPLRERIETVNQADLDTSRAAEARAISGTWASDLRNIAAIKVLNEFGRRNRRLTTGLVSDAVLQDEDYIEVLRISSFSTEHLQEARVGAADTAYEALISQRRAVGPKPRQEALIWRARRRRAEAALKRARVEVKVVTTTGRVKS
jgi:hypothetical protein